MMPALEKVVAEAAGGVRLVKVNIDQNPDLAQALRIQSVPTVYIFHQGRPVDGFTGARPESELRALVDKLKTLAANNDPAAAEKADLAQLLAQGEKDFAAGDYDAAIASYSTALDAAPDNADALAGIAWCLVAQKEMDGVWDILSSLTDDQKAAPRIKGLLFLKDQADAAQELPALAGLSAQVDKNPTDHAARYARAQGAIAAGDLETAIADLVEIVRRDREWQDQKARTLLLALFDAMGNAHPLTAQGRRRLSSVLFS
jgi:putative thioredoxin